MPTPPANDILDCASAAEWEAWLAGHHTQPGGVWLRIARQGAGRPGLTIAEAGEVALCYGWIDSQRLANDQASYWQRYSPRRPASPWSKINVARAEALIAAGRMQPAGLAEIAAAQADGRWAAAYAPQRSIELPPDLADALNRRARARRAWERLGKTRQYALILPLLKANSAASRAARLKTALAELEKGAKK